MKYWFPVRIAAVLVAVAVGALAGARADSDMDAQIRDIVEAELAPTATAADPGGLAAAVYAGGRVTVFDFGFADAAAERTITSDTLFSLASLRKLFEATLVALGRERGEDNRAAMMPEIMQRMVQGYSHDGTPIGPIGNQQSYYDFPGAGQMFSSARDLRILLRACLDRGVIDPELRGALQMTMRESFRVDAKFGQAMAWEHLRLDGATVIDKPGGLNNASAYIGLVPARRFGIVLLANRGDYPHEIARYRILPALARL